MVFVCGFVEKRLPTDVAAVLHVTHVNELVPFERAGRVEAPAAGLAAERRHILRRPVPSADDSAGALLSVASPDDLPVFLVVSHSLVPLQLAVVKESLPTEVAHERLGGAVKKHVSFQLVVLDESLPADFTLERFLPGVNANVSLQVVLEGETGSTRLTRECFPVVNRLVRPERLPPYERFPTHRAGVGVLTCVNTSVAVQRERVPEALAAVGALVRLLGGVYDLMGPQVLFGFEALPTGGAGERLRVRVHQLMSLQAHVCFERLLAELALEGSVPPLLVPQQVLLERLLLPELPRAAVTFEKPLFRVSVHVFLQMKLSLEAFVTDVTNKGFLFLLHSCFLCVLAVSVCCGVVVLCCVWRENR